MAPRESAGERAPLVGGASRSQHQNDRVKVKKKSSTLAAAALFEDIEGGRVRHLARGWSRTTMYGAAFLVLLACSVGLLTSGLFPKDALPGRWRGYWLTRTRGKDEETSAQLTASVVFDEFCASIDDNEVCDDIKRVRAGLGAVDEETYESLVLRAKAVKSDESDDDVGFLGAYDALVTGMVRNPRKFTNLVPEWSTAGLGFEESGQTSDVIDAKKLSLLVADIFPLLRKYPDWDMSDTNQIRYLTRHMHEQQLSTDSVQTAADFLRAAGGNEDEVAILSKSSSSSFSGVLPPTMELQNVPLSPFACMNETQDANALAKLGSTHLAANEHGLPEYFDAREAFPDCSRLLGTVRDQGKCGSCWAVAATEVMNDRLCVATQGNDSAELSPQYALSCYESGHGCQGGDVYSTLAIAFEKGVPKGGMLDKSACLPYEFEPCDHPCMVAGTMPATCPATCADGSPLTFVYPKSMPYVCPEGDTLCIAKEIQAHGSVAVTFGPVYPDFYNFQDGVYKVPDSADEPLGEHATKLIGWGKTDEGEHYWIMVNSWRNWGDNGIGRVRMGEMNMESGIVAVDM